MGLNMYAPLKPQDVSVPNFIKEYKAASDRNWAHLEENYAAYYNKDEYSSFVEIISEKQGYPSGNHSCSRTATSTISVPPADATLPTAEVVRHQDPISGTVFDPIAFPELEIIPINMNVELVTTGRDSSISGMTVTNTHTENTLQPDVTTNGTVASEPPEPSVPATSTVEDTLNPTAVTTGQTEGNATEITDQQTAQLQMTGTAVTSDVTTPTPSLTSNVAVSGPMVPKTKSNHLQCVVKLHRLQSADIVKYTNASAHVNQGKENTTSTQPTQGSPDEQVHMTLCTRSTRSSKHPSHKASTSVNYTNMDVSSTESETDWKKKNPKKKPRLAMAPSKYQLRAHKISQGQAVKSEPSSSEQNYDNAHPHPRTKMILHIKLIMNVIQQNILSPNAKVNSLPLSMASSKGQNESGNLNAKYVTMCSIQQKNGTDTMRRIILFFHV